VRSLNIFVLVLFIAGCGVSKDVWLQEMDKSEAYKKKATSCSSRLEASEKKIEKLKDDLTYAAEKTSASKKELAAVRAKAEKLQADLAAASTTERNLQKNLDSCNQAKADAAKDLAAMEKKYESERRGRAEDKGVCTQLEEERDRLLAEASKGCEEVAALLESAKQKLADETSAFAEEKGRFQEISTDRDRLRQDLDVERQTTERLKEQKADLETRLAVMEKEKQRIQEIEEAKRKEEARNYEDLLEGMKAELEQGQVTISQLKGQLSVNVMNEILFASGSAEINEKGKGVLTRVGEVLQGLADKRIAIEGHTDSVPLKGNLTQKYPTNWELSAARATSVVRYLQNNVGIDPTKLSAVGYGPYQPVESNETAEGKAKNRRIEIKLIPIETAVEGEAGQ